MTVLASTIVPGFPTGSRWPLDGLSGAASILETGRSARVDDYSDVEVPIVVDGAVWGQLCIGATTAEPLRADAEVRMRDFTELVAIAISNTESRDRLRRLAEQQASLRRVATLVAEGGSQSELFSAVAEEIARMLDVSLVSVVRYELDRTALVLASVNAAPGFPVGSRVATEGRRSGYRAVLEETGLPFEPTLEVEADFQIGPRRGGGCREPARPSRAADRHLRLHDAIAVGAMRAARERGCACRRICRSSGSTTSRLRQSWRPRSPRSASRLPRWAAQR
jgi:GAF domain-containing protein